MKYHAEQCPKCIVFGLNEWFEIWNTGSIENDNTSSESLWELKWLKKSTHGERKWGMHTNDSNKHVNPNPCRIRNWNRELFDAAIIDKYVVSNLMEISASSDSDSDDN